MFVIGTLPLTIRVVQSIKRYYDSRLVTHLVNVRASVVFTVYATAHLPIAGWQIWNGNRHVPFLLPLET